MSGSVREFRFSKAYRARFLFFGVLAAAVLGLETFKFAARPPDDPREMIIHVAVVVSLVLTAAYLLSIYRVTAGSIVLQDDALVQVLPNRSRVVLRWGDITGVDRSRFAGRTIVIARSGTRIRIEQQIDGYGILSDEIDHRVPKLNAATHTFHLSFGYIGAVLVPGLGCLLLAALPSSAPTPRMDRAFLIVMGCWIVWITSNAKRSITIHRYTATIRTWLGATTVLHDISGVELRQSRRGYGQFVVITTKSKKRIGFSQVVEGAPLLHEKLTEMLQRLNEVAARHPEIER